MAELRASRLQVPRAEISSFVNQTCALSIKHVHREENKCADTLAKDVPISDWDFYIYPYPRIVSV